MGTENELSAAEELAELRAWLRGVADDIEETNATLARVLRHRGQEDGALPDAVE